MLMLLFHQAEASAGANEVPELPILGGSIISDGFKQLMQQHVFRCVLAYEHQSCWNSH